MVYNKLFISNTKLQAVNFVVMMVRLLPLINMTAGDISRHGKRYIRVHRRYFSHYCGGFSLHGSENADMFKTTTTV